jgi:fatty-acyl-CoA synthase
LVGASSSGRTRRWTYAELVQEAETLARAMAASFRPGNRIAIWAPNDPQYQIVQYAAALAGLIVVTVNPAFRAGEARFALEFAEVAGCFASRDYRGRDLVSMATELQTQLGALHTVVDVDELAEFVANRDPATVLPDVDPDSTAYLLYTSGTTGVPKCAMLSHAAVTDNAAACAANIAGSSADRAVWLATLPMFHLAGCVVAAIGTLSLGGTLVTLRNFDADVALRLIESEHVSSTNLVPTLMWALLRHPDFGRTDVSSLHSVMLGGATVPPELVRQVRELGVTPIVGYGLTEATSIAMTRASDRGLDYSSAIGHPMAHVEVRITDPTSGDVCATGVVGQIETRGFHTFQGYWKNPDATREIFVRDNWLRTGDLGTIDDDGIISIVGRAKEMIIRGGENVYPREIEDHLMRLEGVLDAAVIGLPDDYYGEVVAAFVTRSPSLPTRRELEATLREAVTGYKVPSKWFFLDELPVTASGKIQKFALLEGWRSGAHTEEPP